MISDTLSYALITRHRALEWCNLPISTDLAGATSQLVVLSRVISGSLSASAIILTG